MDNVAPASADDQAASGSRPFCAHCDRDVRDLPLGEPCPGCGWPRLRYLYPSTLPATFAEMPLTPCCCCALFQQPDFILGTLPIALCLDCADCDRRLTFDAGRQRHALHISGTVPSHDIQAAWRRNTEGRRCRICQRAGELVARIAGDICRDRIIGVDGRCIGCIVTQALEQATAATPAAPGAVPDTEAADLDLWRRGGWLCPACPDGCGGFLRQLTDAVRAWCADPKNKGFRPRLPDILKRLDIGRESFSRKRSAHNLPVQRWPGFVAAVTRPAQSSTQ